MPSGVADYGATTWLGMLFGVTAVPSGYYVAAFVDEPGDSMDGSMFSELEPSDPSYARRLVAANATKWSLDGAYLTNTEEVRFPAASEDQGILPYYGLCSALTGGELYSWGEILNPAPIYTGGILVLPEGAIVVSLTALSDPIAV